MAAPKWHALWVGDTYNPRVVEEARTASGAYAIREKKTHVVRYVGESARGTIWKTMLRHFQAPESFAAQRETGVFTGAPSLYEVALHITSRGPRPRAPAKGSAPSKRLRDLKRRGIAHRTDADQRAMAAQARWIASLKPTNNKDDGLAGDVAAQELRAVRAKQEAEDRDAGAFGSLLNPASDEAQVLALLGSGGKVTATKVGARWVVVGVSPHGSEVAAGIARSKSAAMANLLVLLQDEARRAAFAKAYQDDPGLRGRSDEAARLAEIEASLRGRSDNPAPAGALNELGKLTRLEPTKGAILRWSLRQAPTLAYDDAGRLFILYRVGRIVRSSSPAEMREYARTHWGQSPKGKVRQAGVAPGPFVRLAAAKSITYTTKKGFDSKLVDYVHPFGEGASAKGFVPPQIVEHECVGGCGARCAARGALSLQGGSYRVTSRGIVG